MNTLPGPGDTIVVSDRPTAVQAIDAAAHAVLHDPTATPRERGLCAAIMALVDDRTVLRDRIEAASTLAEGWIGFDDSHHYGDALMKAVTTPEVPDD